MADGTKILVAVERAVHNALCDLAKNVYEQHGIQINSAQFDWWDISTAGQPRAMLVAVTVDSKTTALPEGPLKTGDGQ